MWALLLAVLAVGHCSDVGQYGASSAAMEAEMPVMVLPIHKSADLYHVVIWKRDIANYDKIIRKFCYDYQIAAFSCDNVLRIAEEQLTDVPLQPRVVCSERYKDERSCINLLQSIATPPKTDFDTLDMRLLKGYSEGLQLSHLQSLVKFMNMLHDRECSHDRIDSSYTVDDGSDGLLPSFPEYRVDKSNFLVPCNVMKWSRGQWHVRSSVTSRDFSISRCPMRKFHVINEKYGNFGWNMMCETYFPARNMLSQGDSGSDGCIVYSFGSNSGHPEYFEQWSAERFGCEVHIFESGSKSHENNGEKFSDHVHRHPLLLGTDAYATQVINLPAIADFLGHHNQAIDAVKVDCAGCEWSSLNRTMSLYPQHTKRICNLMTRLHFCYPVDEMNSSDMFRELNLMTQFYNEFVLMGPFKMVYRHQTSSQSYNLAQVRFMGAEEKSKTLFPILQNMGFDPNICTYEVTFANEMCHQEVGGNSPSISTVRSSNTGARGEIGLRDPLKEKDIFDNPAVSLDNLAESHRYLSHLNATIALYSNDNSIHSEIIGPLVDLSYSLGFSRVVIYYDFYGRSEEDIASRKIVFGSMVPIFEGWEGWDIRPPRKCFAESEDWDVVLMLTGDEIYRDKELVEHVKAVSHRVVAIQHHPAWMVPSLYRKNVLLTPFHGWAHFIFPFMRISSNIPKGGGTFDSYDKAIDLTSFEKIPGKTMLLLGSIGEVERKTKPGVDRKYKDRDDIVRYLQQDRFNTVFNIAKFQGDPFESIVHDFPGQAVLFYGIHSFDLVKIVNMSTFVWLPIPSDSLYMKGVFASSLSFAFGLKKILVMPRALSSLFKLRGAVVEYEQSITEVDWNKVDMNTMRQRMDDWEKAQRVQNIVNMHKCLFSKGFCDDW